MAYRIDKTGASVEELLDQVANKTIYPLATTENDGIMSKEMVGTLERLDTGDLTEEMIRLICI